MTDYDDIRIQGSGTDVKTDSCTELGKSGQTGSPETTNAELERLREAVNAQKNPPPERSLSAMQVIVDYRIEPGSVTHTARGEDHIFDVEVPFAQDFEKKPVNAFALREKFLCAQGWSGAFDFLRVTGPFWTVGDRITLKEFEFWQDFANGVLVKEKREALSSAFRDGNCSEEEAERLKALTGLYASSFLEWLGVRETQEEAISLREPSDLTPVPQLAELMRQSNIETAQWRVKSEQRRLERLKALFAWFRRPPENACSIRWLPKGPEEWKEALELLKAGRVLLDADARPGLEFSLPRTALTPVLVIEAQCSLHAIAASIYADYWNGVEYKKCPECGRVFRLGEGKRVGRWQEREHCSNRCKQAGVNRNRGKRVPKRSLGSKRNRKSEAARMGGKV